MLGINNSHMLKQCLKQIIHEGNIAVAAALLLNVPLRHFDHLAKNLITGEKKKDNLI